MKKIIGRIWGIIYVPIIYMAVQIIVVSIFIAVGLSLISATLVSALISIIIFYFIWRKDKKTLEKPIKSFTMLRAFLVIAIAICLYFVTTYGLSLFYNPEVEQQQESMRNFMLSDSLIMQIVCIAIMAPIVEELLFRGIVFNRLRKFAPIWVAVIIQALLFGLMHFNSVQSIYTIFVGIVFALIYLKIKSLWAPMLAHCVYNLIPVIIVQFVQDVPDVSDVEIEVIPVLIMMAVISCIGALFGIALKKQKIEVIDWVCIKEKEDVDG